MALPETPITRKETFLAKAAGQDVPLPEDTLTREEAYLREIAEGGGTSDYSDLTNKPSINSVTLSGDKSASDLGLAEASDIPGLATDSAPGIVQPDGTSITIADGVISAGGSGIPISKIKDLSAFDEVVNTDDPNMTFLSAVTALGSKIDNSKVTTNTKVYFVMQSGKGFYCLSLISYGEDNFKYYFGAENVNAGNYPVLMQVKINGSSNMYIGGSLVNGTKIYDYGYNGFLGYIIAIGIIYQ